MKTIIAFFLGAAEFQSSNGRTYGDRRDEAYDMGRELAHRVTRRRYEQYETDTNDWCSRCEKFTQWNDEFCARKCGKEWGYE